MPIALDPTQTFKIDAHGGWFECRYLTASQWRRLSDALTAPGNSGESGESGGDRIGELFAQINASIVDWLIIAPDGKRYAAASNRLVDLLTYPEGLTLGHRILEGATLGELDKKKSESPRQSSPASSAASADRADASTPPAIASH